MARAERIPGIQRKQSLHDNAQRAVDTRLTEFLSWRYALFDPAEAKALHNMRIAAKRLRYTLEAFEVCFPEARPLIKKLTRVQDDLGDIHDLDVLASLMRDQLATRTATIAEGAVEIAEATENRGQQMDRLRSALYSQARDPRRLGLLALIGEKVVERKKRYQAFKRKWGGKRLDRFADDVRAAAGLDEPPQSDSTHEPEGKAG